MEKSAVSNNKIWKRIFREQEGATLAEMAVTLAVLGILLAISAAGLVIWQRNSIYTQSREYARTLFLAAQLSLGRERNAGTLEELEKYMKDGGKGSGPVPADQHGTQRELYYLDILPGETDSILYQLLNPYLYDSSVLDAAIRLEFDPADGTVFAVSRCEKADGFAYTGGNENRIELSAQTRRDERLQKELLWGYYDSALSEKVQKEEKKPPLLRQVSLDNGECLMLECILPKKFQPFWMEFQYRIELYDNHNRLAVSFVLTSEELRDTDQDPGTLHRANVPVILYDSDGNRKERMQCAMEVTVNPEGGICILLDGMDLMAARILEEGLYGEAGKIPDASAFARTCSIYRLMAKDASDAGIPADAERIYAKVCVADSSEKGEDLIWGRGRTSNEESPFMGDVHGGLVRTYEMTRMRHLFNIRFTESILRDREEIQVTYLQKETLVWGGKDGVIQQRAVFCSGELDEISLAGNSQESADSAVVVPEQICGKVRPNGKLTRWGRNLEYAPFPAIPFLRGNSILSADQTGENECEIRNLTLRELQEDIKTVRYALGLIRVNLGQVRNLNLRDVRVDGTAYTGAVVGVNRGRVEAVNVLGEALRNPENNGASPRGYVRGTNYVGGIAGSGLSSTYSELTNESDVYGKSYVGGILGADQSDFEKAVVTIQNCTNRGCVEVDESYSLLAKVPFHELNFIGGIVGYMTGGSVENCMSFMGPETGIDRVYEESRFWFIGEDIFLGNFVGGIAGYLQDTELTCCSVDGGMVFGHSYVGGYVGLYSGENGYVLDGNNSINRADVLGWEYVGGIVGANSGFGQNGSADRTCREELCLQNWRNQGIILAASGYAGGIAGINTGILKNCVSNTDLSEVTAEYIAGLVSMVQAMDAVGYVGGLTGYNSGKVEADQKQSVTCVINGQDYVGGLIGYQDAGGNLDKSNYRLEGGTVTGHSFVGGAIGLNASAEFFEEAEETASVKILEVRPNLVKGRAFVGGLIGGNILTDDIGKNCFLSAAVKNTFGSVNGQICTGGLVGYLDTVSEEEEGTDRAARTAARAAVLAGAVRADWDSQTGTWTGINVLKILEGADDVSEKTETALNQTGTEAGIVLTDCLALLDQVEGGLHVGGILGFAEDSVKLTILRGKTTSDLVSTGVMRAENDADTLYAFAGGITGRISRQTVIDNCSVSGSHTVASEVKYYGRLAEVNEGTIYNCRVLLQPAQRDGIVGGVVGKNGRNGLISLTSVYGNGGSSEVYGGIAGANSGEIRECQLTEEQVCVEGNLVGGIVGTGSGSIRKTVFSGQVYSSGKRNACAGGIIGQITEPDDGRVVELTDCINHGSIVMKNSSGYQFSGGIVGADAQSDSQEMTVRLYNCVNTGTVAGGNGAGIYGTHQSAGRVEFLHCRNYGYGKSGILEAAGNRAGETLMQYCFGVAALEHPLAELADLYWDKRGKQNYYFTDRIMTEDRPRIRAVFSGGTGDGNLMSLTDGDETTCFTENLSGEAERMTLTLYFEEEEGMPTALPVSELDLLWKEDFSDEKTYILKVRYEQEDEFVPLSSEGEIWNGNYAELNQYGLLQTDRKIEAVLIEFLTEKIAVCEVVPNVIRYPEKTDERGEALVVTQLEEGNGWKAGEPVRIPFLSMNPCEITSESERRELYEEIDAKLRLMDWTEKPPEAVELFSVSNGNPLHISWKEVPEAYAYLVNLRLFEDEELQNEISGAGIVMSVPGRTGEGGEIEIAIPVKQIWGNRYLRAEIVVLGDASGLENGNASETVYSNAVKLPKVLDVPDAYLEYLYDESGAYVTVSLDNLSDYRPENILQLETDIGEVVRIPMTEEHFDLKTGCGSGKGSNRIPADGELWQTVCGKRLIFRMLPGDEEDYMESAEKIIELPPITDSYLQETPLTQIRHISENGIAYLIGTGPEDLGYTVMLEGGNYGGYYETQILLTDPATGNCVTAASVRAKAEAGKTIRAELGPFSDEAVEMLWQKVPQISVRTWLLETADGGLRFGRRASGESTILSADGGTRYAVQKKETIVQIPMQQPEPVIRETWMEQDGSFVFEWDTEYGEEAEYLIRVLGVTEKEEKNNVLQSGPQKEKKIAVPAEEWNYEKLELCVIKQGSLYPEPVDGMTMAETLYSLSTMTFEVCRSLPRIQGVKMELSGGSREELLYDISWDGVSGEQNQNALAAYQVFARIAGGGEEECTVLLGTVTDPILLSCDLEEFAGKRVEIYVNALAKEEEEGSGFSDSPEGVHLTGITLPLRKELPEIEVSVDFSDLTVSVESDSQETGGYRIRAGIYAISDDREVCVWPENGTLETGRVPGTLAQTEYELHFPINPEEWQEALAGKELRLSFRAVSDSEISSVWSEEFTFLIPGAEQAEASDDEEER